MHRNLDGVRASILLAVTVYRVGPPPEQAPPHRVELGIVLVTIDDLNALLEVLNKGSSDKASETRIEFDGGYFTEPEDLRTLSDMEIRSLRLKTENIEIVLNPTDAFAVGDRQEAENVHRLWARARQIPLKMDQKALLFAMAPVFALLGLIASSFWLVWSVMHGYVINGPFLTLIAAAMGLYFLTSRNRKDPYPCAVIVPLSLAEHRQSQSNQMYPRRGWIVAVVAVIVAMISAGAAIWFGIHK